MSVSNPFEQAPTRARLGVLGFVCGLSLITYLDRVCIMRASQAIQADLAISKTQMGFVFSAFLLGYALFEVPGGWMGDRWGSRRVIAGIVLWWSFFTALSGFAPAHDPASGQPTLFGLLLPAFFNGFVLLLLVRFLFGLGEAGAYPNLARVVGAWFPYGERGLAQGSIWMCARLGGAVAPFVFGRMMTYLGWREAFWILGLVGIVWAVWFHHWFRNTPEEQPQCNDAERAAIRAGPYSFKADQAQAGHAFPPWRSLVFNSNIWAVCVASAGVSFGWYFYPTWQPEFLKQRFGIDFKDSEIITGLPFLFGAFGSLIGGGLSDWLVRRTGSRRWGRSLLGLFGFLGAGTCVLGTGFVTEAWQAIALLCVAFFINDLAIPCIWAVSTDIGGRYAGTVAGVMNMAGGLGSVVSPSLTPILLYFHFDWPAIFAVLAGGWFIAGLAWLRIDATQTIEPESTADKHQHYKELAETAPPAAPGLADERIQSADEHIGPSDGLPKREEP